MTEFAIIDTWDGGFGWMAHPNEFMRRASHAIQGQDGLWLVDPLVSPEVTAYLDDGGPVAGVIVTLDRHTRDADLVARKYDIPVTLDRSLDHLRDELETPAIGPTYFTRDTSFAIRSTVNLPGWKEIALHDPVGGTLIVGDALGTAPYFSPPQEPLSVHPLLRLFPPVDSFTHLDADRVLVGHGLGVMEDGVDAVEFAFQRARRGIPRAWTNALIEIGRSPARFRARG